MVARPDFTVVIPSYGRPGPLAACVRSLAELDFPRDRFEVLLIDDGSAESLESIVRLPDGRPDCRWVRLPENVGPAAARNAGALAASGAYLAFIDDDCLADRAWLARLGAALEANPDAAAGGSIVNGCGGNLYCEADQAVLDVAYAHYNAVPSAARFFSSCNMAVPADLFREAGGFDPTYRTAEDREFCARWLAGGRRLVLAADAVVAHAAARSLRRFWRRHYEFGRGAYRFRGRYARSSGGRLSLEAPGFYRRLALAPFTGGDRSRAATVSALIVLSQVASALGFAASWRAAHTSKALTG